MTKEEIEEINNKCELKDLYTDYEGILTEPSGIPVHIKEPVIYMRWNAQGASGGSYDDDEDDEGAVWYENPKPNFKVIDLVLEKIAPNFKYSDFNKVNELIHFNSETDYEYYGNYSDYHIEYIILSELEKLIKDSMNDK